MNPLPYGCHNQQRSESYRAPDQQYHGKTWTDWQREIADTSSRECRYDRKNDDPKCGGCGK